MQVIDSHLHLDSALEGDAFAVTDALVAELEQAKVSRGVLLHLSMQRWPRAEVAKAVERHQHLIAFANVHPFDDDCMDQLSCAIEVEGYKGLKLHPRLQDYPVNHERTQALVQHAGRLGVPVIMDAFPDGEWLLQGHHMADFGHLARACPDTQIVAAHMGGFQVLELAMVAKRCPNLFLDISFSLLYYRSSSVPADMVYGMKSMRYQKLFYGSDYPDRGVGETFEESVSLLKSLGTSELELARLLYGNAEEFFAW